MIELAASDVHEYLLAAGRAAASERVVAHELSGGVSNVVLLVTLPERGERFVLKQARGKLRVKEDWQCSVERIWREVETLRICGELLTKASSPAPSAAGWLASFEPAVPQILWEDRENYAYAMTAAPEGHRTWKDLLLAGELPLSHRIATACGQLLAALHGGSWGNAAIAEKLDDRSFFDHLRLDPYYRQVARVHANLATPLKGLVDSVWSHRRCLVHGDFSPKNLLVWQGHVLLIDFEVGHYGDPAFDLGFFLTHLALKSFWSGPRQADYLRLATLFWRTYEQALTPIIGKLEWTDLEGRSMLNLAGCMLARVDGKSPVEYLSPPLQERVRQLTRGWLLDSPKTWDEACSRL